MDVRELNPRQRANVAGLKLKRDAIQRKYGNAVQIITTDEEAANASGWMAMPIGLINTNKQLTLRMDRQVVDTLKSRKLEDISRDSVADTDGIEDVVTALESSAYGYTKPKATTPTRLKTDKRAEQRSNVTDSDFIKSLLGK